jgi:hypothetical protein
MLPKLWDGYLEKSAMLGKIFVKDFQKLFMSNTKKKYMETLIIGFLIGVILTKVDIDFIVNFFKHK